MHIVRCPPYPKLGTSHLSRFATLCICVAAIYVAYCASTTLAILSRSPSSRSPSEAETWHEATLLPRDTDGTVGSPTSKSKIQAESQIRQSRPQLARDSQSLLYLAREANTTELRPRGAQVDSIAAAHQHDPAHRVLRSAASRARPVAQPVATLRGGAATQKPSPPSPASNPVDTPETSPTPGALSKEERHRATALIFEGPRSEGPPFQLPPSARAAIGRHAACAALYQDLPEGPASVALVGNGPVSVADKAHLERMDIVIRINTMNTWSCGERLDIWMMRHSEGAALQWHGIGNTVRCPTAEALASRPFLWFFGDNSEGWYDENLLAEAVAMYPELTTLPRAGISYAPWRNLFQKYVVTSSSPTTGWVGMVLVLDCAPQAVLHLFGFNWNKHQWRTHRILYEQQFAAGLQARGRIVVHPPPCKDLRACGGCSVIQYAANGTVLACNA